jgi:hypothetical protein
VGETGALSNAPTPTDFGYKSWSLDPQSAINATAPASGTLYIARMKVSEPTTVSKLALGVVSVSGMTLTVGQCFVGFFDPAGNQLGVSADIAGLISSTGELTFDLGTPFVAESPYIYGGVLLNGTTPTLARANGQLSNFGSGQLTAATRRFGTAGSGLTAMPATFNPATTNPVTNQGYWMAAVGPSGE